MYQRGGFTLIELLVVILIIGTLAAVALPQYQFAVYKTHVAKAIPLANKLVEANQLYYMANGSYTKDWRLLDVAFPAGCTYEPSSQLYGYGYDRLRCPGLYFALGTSGSIGLNMLVERCPVGGGSCIIYWRPVQGSPYCYPYPSPSSSVKAYGEKVCQALGGKKNPAETNNYYYF